MTDKTQVKKPSRQNRFFSEEFKKQKVKELEESLLTITEISQDYGVSRTSVYKWIYKYSMNMKKGVRQVIESNSDTKKFMLLKEKIKAEIEKKQGDSLEKSTLP